MEIVSDCPFRTRPVIKYCGRPFPPELVSCPTCGRNENEDFPDKARAVMEALRRANRPDLRVSVLNCLVNGPGEAKGSDVGLVFGRGKAAIYQQGKLVASVKTEEAIGKLLEVISNTW